MSSITEKPKPLTPERMAAVAIAGLAIAAALAALPRLVSGSLTATAPIVTEAHTAVLPGMALDSIPRLRAAQSWGTNSLAGLYLAKALQVEQMDGEADVLAELLSASPARPDLWLRLARLRKERGDKDGALRAWRTSTLVGRISPAITAPRMAMGMALYPDMTVEDHQLLREQIRVTYILRPTQVGRMISDTANAPMIPLIASVLTSLTPLDYDLIYRIHGQH